MNDQIPDDKALRSFGLMMGGVIAVLFGLLLPWLFDAQAYPLLPWWLCAAFVLCAITLPRLLAPVYKVWMKFGHVMGWINSRLLLVLIYFLIFLPFGLLMRFVFFKDPMARKIKTAEKSYRKVRDTEIEPKDMEKPF